MKTLFQSQEQALSERKWFHFDANDQVVGRLATRIAAILRGKENVNFTPHHDCGDFVVVTNVEKIRFTGEKAGKKVYYKHTGFVGNLKTRTAEQLLQTKPEDVLMNAVRGMLPKTPLGRAQLLKLKIYRGGVHPHTAQQPVTLEGR